MTESEVTELIVAITKIEGKVDNIQLDVTEIKKSANVLFTRTNDLRSRLDILETEHNDRTQNCSNSSEDSLIKLLLRPKTLILLALIALLTGVPTMVIILATKGIIS